MNKSEQNGLIGCGSMVHACDGRFVHVSEKCCRVKIIIAVHVLVLKDCVLNRSLVLTSHQLSPTEQAKHHAT